MNHNFRFTALPHQAFAHLAGQSNEALAAQGIRRLIADASPGFPCRVSLADAEIGETLLLLPFRHHDTRSPYQASGPVFVRENAVSAHPGPGEIPLMFTVNSRLFSLRAYGADGMMRQAEVAEGTQLREVIGRLFADPDTAYLHIHFARPGCFACAVVRC